MNSSNQILILVQSPVHTKDDKDIVLKNVLDIKE